MPSGDGGCGRTGPARIAPPTRTIARSGPGSGPTSEEGAVHRRGRTDYRLLRRAALDELRAGRRGRDDVCDAHPELVRAGRHIGTVTREACPVCQADGLRQVTYAFGVGTARGGSGRAVPRQALARHAARHGDLTVYAVEVCLACHWHHLRESFEVVARDSAVG